MLRNYALLSRYVFEWNSVHGTLEILVIQHTKVYNNDWVRVDTSSIHVQTCSETRSSIGYNVCCSEKNVMFNFLPKVDTVKSIYMKSFSSRHYVVKVQ